MTRLILLASLFVCVTSHASTTKQINAINQVLNKAFNGQVTDVIKSVSYNPYLAANNAAVSASQNLQSQFPDRALTLRAAAVNQRAVRVAFVLSGKINYCDAYTSETGSSVNVVLESCKGPGVTGLECDGTVTGTETALGSCLLPKQIGQ